MYIMYYIIVVRINRKQLFMSKHLHIFVIHFISP